MARHLILVLIYLTAILHAIFRELRITCTLKANKADLEQIERSEHRKKGLGGQLHTDE